MSLLIVNLERADFLSDVLLALTQVGVTNAAILEGEDSGREISRAVPLFAGLVEGFGHAQEYCRVILAPVNGPDVADQLVRALEDGGIDWDKERLGWIAVLPTDRTITPHD